MKISSINSQPSLNITTSDTETSKIKVGQTIKATILNIKPEEVALKLDDGTIISAKVLSSLDAAIGDNIELLVKDKNQNQFILQNVKSSDSLAGKLNDIKELLFNLKLPINDKSIGVVQHLISLKMPVSIENIKLALNIISNFENIDAQKAVFMLANDITPEDKNVKLLNANLIKDVFKAEFTNLENEIISIKDNNLKARLLDVLGTNNYKNNIKLQELSENITKLIPDSYSNKDKLSQEMVKNIISIFEDLSSEENNLILKNINTVDIEQEFSNTIHVIKQNTKEIENLLLNSHNKVIDDNNIDNIVKLIKNSLSKDINNILDKFRDIISIEKDEMKIDDLIKKAIDDISIKVSKTLESKDLNVNELYKDIYKKLEVIKNIGSESSDRNNLSSTITNIQDNIKFVNTINNNMAYIPIPLNIDDNRTTGQLYILKNNKNAKINPMHASLYLSLDMPNLGTVGILVNIDKNNISLNFKSESDKSIEVIKNNYSKLIEVLKNKSYNVLDVTFSVFNDTVNMLNVTNVLNEKVKTMTFDIRI